jgi:excisionase family DNA binding protein
MNTQGQASASHDVLTIPEVADELRCSKAHVHHLISGKVHGARPLPSLRLGRRRVVRRTSLNEWIKATEESCYDPITSGFIA